MPPVHRPCVLLLHQMYFTALFSRAMKAEDASCGVLILSEESSIFLYSARNRLILQTLPSSSDMTAPMIQSHTTGFWNVSQAAAGGSSDLSQILPYRNMMKKKAGAGFLPILPRNIRASGLKSRQKNTALF